MAINWPEATLGLPTIDGYSVSPEERVGRTPVAGGPPRFKRRNPTAPIRVSARWVWSESQYETFSSLLRVTLRDGERAVEIRLRVERGAPEPRVCYFAGEVSARWLGTRYEVIAGLEVLAADLEGLDPGLFHDIVDGGLASAPSAGGPIDAGTATAPADPANVIGGLTPREIP